MHQTSAAEKASSSAILLVAAKRLPADADSGFWSLLRPEALLCIAGINASDINHTAGRYFGSPEMAAKRLPL